MGNPVLGSDISAGRMTKSVGVNEWRSAKNEDVPLVTRRLYALVKTPVAIWTRWKDLGEIWRTHVVDKPRRT